MFHAMDADGNGEITLEEIASADPALKDELMLCLKADDMVDLFEILDVDGSGEISIEEFVEGITKITTSEQSMETMTILKHLKMLRKEVKEQHRGLDDRLTRLEELMSTGKPVSHYNGKTHRDN